LREEKWMNVLFSIRPEYANEIFSGRKRYEFRRTIFKKTDVSTIYLYANSSIRRIVGRFDVGTIYQESPSNLWRTFHENAGIARDAFFNYYDGCTLGYAIEIINARAAQPHANPYSLLGTFTPPQSFCYLTDDQAQILESHF
jgi:type I restriction enzyme, S subunit